MNNKRNISLMKSIKFKGKRNVQLEIKKKHILEVEKILRSGQSLDSMYDLISKYIPMDIAMTYLEDLKDKRFLEIKSKIELKKQAEDMRLEKNHEIVDKEEKRSGLDDESISHHVTKNAPSILIISVILIVLYFIILATKTI